MNLQELLAALNQKIQADNNVQNLPVLIGALPYPNCVVALIIIDKASKYRKSHIRFAESLEQLLCEVKEYYDIADDDLIKSIIPLAGFTTADIIEMVGEN